MPAKSIISSNHAINWYYSNFLMSPNNALRDVNENAYLEKVHKLIDELKIELKGRSMTHKQFMDLMKEKGIHDSIYLADLIRKT